MINIESLIQKTLTRFTSKGRETGLNACYVQFIWYTYVYAQRIHATFTYHRFRPKTSEGPFIRCTRIGLGEIRLLPTPCRDLSATKTSLLCSFFFSLSRALEGICKSKNLFLSRGKNGKRGWRARTRRRQRRRQRRRRRILRASFQRSDLCGLKGKQIARGFEIFICLPA